MDRLRRELERIRMKQGSARRASRLPRGFRPLTAPAAPRCPERSRAGHRCRLPSRRDVTTGAPARKVHGVPRSTGSADLPLHGGRVPQWLGERMSRLGRVITEAVVLRYGRDRFLRRLAHPFWFQSLGAVMGMDWHSSGITTLHAVRHRGATAVAPAG